MPVSFPMVANLKYAFIIFSDFDRFQLNTCIFNTQWLKSINLILINNKFQQPGCGWDVSGACAHGRAYEFYLESINKQQFFAFECESIDNLRHGNCSVVNEIVRMGGEPGNKM